MKWVKILGAQWQVDALAGGLVVRIRADNSIEPLRPLGDVWASAKAAAFCALQEQARVQIALWCDGACEVRVIVELMPPTRPVDKYFLTPTRPRNPKTSPSLSFLRWQEQCARNAPPGDAPNCRAIIIQGNPDAVPEALAAANALNCVYRGRAPSPLPPFQPLTGDNNDPRTPAACVLYAMFRHIDPRVTRSVDPFPAIWLSVASLTAITGWRLALVFGRDNDDYAFMRGQRRAETLDKQEDVDYVCVAAEGFEATTVPHVSTSYAVLYETGARTYYHDTLHYAAQLAGLMAAHANQALAVVVGGSPANAAATDILVRGLQSNNARL